MNQCKFGERIKREGAARRAVTLLMTVALISQSFFTGTTSAQQRPQTGSAAQAKSLSENERIIHVLNRLGYGARPGDVERVRRMGLERYIEQQLHPETMKDEVVEARLRSLPTLTMSNAELLAKYPSPGQLLRRLERRGELPPELAALRKGRRKDAPAQKPTAGDDASMSKDEGLSKAGMKSGTESAGMEANGAGEVDAPDRQQYRRVVREYMREHNLQLPARIIAELQSARILRARYSERQLQEVLVDFWTNHFNVFAGKGADRWLLTSYDRDVIRPHALGRFRDLLGATAKSPAMLFYLDNFQSASPQARMAGGNRRRDFLSMFGGEMAGGGARMNARRRARREARERERQNEAAMPEGVDAMPQAAGEMMTARPQMQRKRARRGINENYARELMELHTLGVEGGYTQKDVQEVARAFTGWTIFDPRGAMGNENGGRFYFNPRLHDDGEKVVLGQKIPAGGGERDGERVLDILARHPSTARFIATKLARRFVSDNPSPALVARISAAYTKSDGDIRETLRAIFTSPEFNSAEARRAKIKTPFELAISALRALDAETNGAPALHQWIARMGEPLYGYQAPTGYPDTAEHWVNTGALLERLNFALALASNRIAGTRVDLSRVAGEAATSSRTVNQEKLIEQFADLILQGELSPKTRATLVRQLSDQANAPIASDAPSEVAGDAQMRMETDMRGGRRGQRRRGAGMLAEPTVGNPEVARIAALILGSPEFQRQ